MPDAPSSSSSSPRRNPGWQPPSLAEMQLLLPQYQFESLLGCGGMGAVYKAKQTSLDRDVAIKILPAQLMEDADSNYLERFRNEARTMARMSHPAIIQVWDFGEAGENLLYIVMEFIDGTDIAHMIASQGRLLPDHALAITAHVCDALHYAHEHGVVHRDIKPANVLINQDGEVKIADFGLAKSASDGAGLTNTNIAMGTPDYIAPEALLGDEALDGRADLYAVGVMLHQMLSGEIPRGVWKPPAAALGLDPRFDAVIKQAMQSDRQDRYQSALDIRRDLDAILSGPVPKQQPARKKAVASRPAPGTPLQRRSPARANATASQPLPKGRSKSSSALICTAVAAVAGVVALLLWDEDPRTEAVDAPVVDAPAPDPDPPRAAVEGVPAPIPVPAPALSAKPAFGPAVTEAEDLLAGLDPEKAAVKGEWSRTGGTITSQAQMAAQVLEFPRVPPEEYDLGVAFSFQGGQPEFSLMFPHAGRTLLWKMGWGGANPMPCGFGPYLDGVAARDPERTEAVARLPLFEIGKRYQCVLQVRKGKLTALLDGKPVAAWAGDFQRLEGEEFFQLSAPAHLGVASWGSAITLHRATLLPPSAEFFVAESPAPEAPSAKPVAERPDQPLTPEQRREKLARERVPGESDALPIEDWEKQVVVRKEYEWTRVPEGLRQRPIDNPGPYKTVIQLPVDLPRDYVVEWWFTSAVDGGESGLTIPVADKRVTTCWIWSVGGGTAGLGKVDGADPGTKGLPPECDAPFRVKAGELQYGRVSVQRLGPTTKIHFQMNGETVARFEGATERLFFSTSWVLHGDWSVPQLGARHDTTFHRVIVGPLDNPHLRKEGLLQDYPDLAQMHQSFEERMAKEATGPFDKEVAKLNHSYLTNALAPRRDTARQAGNLTRVTWLDQERQHIESAGDVPNTDEPTLPEDLQQLRQTYREARAVHRQAYVESAAALHRAHVFALDEWFAEKTASLKAGEKEWFVESFQTPARAALEELGQEQAAGQVAVATPAAPSSPAAPPPALPATLRDSMEKLLRLGARFTVKTDANIAVAKVEDIPPEPFSVIGLILDRFNSLLPPLTEADFDLLLPFAQLQKVWIREAPVSDSAFRFLASNPELTSLHLELCVNVTDELLNHLVSAPKLTGLGIVHPKGFTGARLAGKPFLASLESVNFFATGLNQEGLSHLGQCPNLTSLEMASCDVGDEAFKALSAATSLTTLKASGTGFGDTAAQVVSQLDSLINLDIGGAQLKRPSWELLQSMKQLKNLTIKNTNASPEVISLLKAALPDCEILTEP